MTEFTSSGELERQETCAQFLASKLKMAVAHFPEYSSAPLGYLQDAPYRAPIMPAQDYVRRDITQRALTPRVLEPNENEIPGWLRFSSLPRQATFSPAAALTSLHEHGVAPVQPLPRQPSLARPLPRTVGRRRELPGIRNVFNGLRNTRWKRSLVGVASSTSLSELPRKRSVLTASLGKSDNAGFNRAER